MGLVRDRESKIAEIREETEWQLVAKDKEINKMKTKMAKQSVDIEELRAKGLKQGYIYCLQELYFFRNPLYGEQNFSPIFFWEGLGAEPPRIDFLLQTGAFYFFPELLFPYFSPPPTPRGTG